MEMNKIRNTLTPIKCYIGHTPEPFEIEEPTYVYFDIETDFQRR